MLLDRPDLVVFCRGLPTAALVRADRKASLSLPHPPSPLRAGVFGVTVRGGVGGYVCRPPEMCWARLVGLVQQYLSVTPYTILANR